MSIFTTERYFNILIDNFKFYQSKYNIEIFAYVFMMNHFHMICKSCELRKAIQSFKSFTAKEIIRELINDDSREILNKLKTYNPSYKIESEYQVWQEGFHPEEIRNNLVMIQKIEYIHYNPVKKKLVLNPEDWKYSSAGYYLKGSESILDITPYI